MKALILTDDDAQVIRDLLASGLDEFNLAPENEAKVSAIIKRLDLQPAVKDGDTDIPIVTKSVRVLHKHPCPTCGCPAYDEDASGENDPPLRRFLRRIAWAQQALNEPVSIKTRIVDGHPVVTKVVVGVRGSQEEKGLHDLLTKLCTVAMGSAVQPYMPFGLLDEVKAYLKDGHAVPGPRPDRTALEAAVCTILREHGPDGHIDGYDKIVDYIESLLGGAR